MREKKAVGFDKRTFSAPPTADTLAQQPSQPISQPTSAASTVRIRPASGLDPDASNSTIAPTPLLARARAQERQRGSVSSLNFVKEEETDSSASQPMTPTEGPTWEMMEEFKNELRRDFSDQFANLHLDMVRMMRGLKVSL